MTIALALLGAAALVAVLMPRLLWRLHRTRLDPLVLITGWTLSGVGVLGTAATAILLLLLPQHGMPSDLVRAVHGCWLALGHGAPPGTEQIAGLVGATVLAAVAVRIVLIGRRQTIRRRQARAQRRAVLRLAGRSVNEEPTPAGPPTLWLEHDRPLAFSLPGRGGLVVATEGLAERLAPVEVAAVLEHERAHMRGRHHLLLATAEAIAWALPMLPLLRQARAALPDLVEFAADATAARRCGARVLHDALARIADVDLPPTALAAGSRVVEQRLRRLASSVATRGPARRVLGASLMGAAFLVAPVAIAGLAFVSAATIAC
jgi:Zn-dependent protease with chaperone function